MLVKLNFTLADFLVFSGQTVSRINSWNLPKDQGEAGCSVVLWILALLEDGGHICFPPVLLFVGRDHSSFKEVILEYQLFFLLILLFHFFYYSSLQGFIPSHPCKQNPEEAEVFSPDDQGYDLGFFVLLPPLRIPSFCPAGKAAFHLHIANRSLPCLWIWGPAEHFSL